MNRLVILMAVLLAFIGSAGADPVRSSLIERFLRQPVGTVPIERSTGAVREFTLEVHRIHAEIAPGVKVEQWAFAFPGQAPSVPGPELRVKQGDLVRLTFRNTLDQPHTIHPHGIISVAERMDGLIEVLPGQSYTYEFVATEAGTFAYHCHFQTNLHLNMGMYGALIVEPRDQRVKVWKTEHTLILDDWDTRQDPSHPVHKPQPNYFLMNGKAAPLIPDLPIPEGDVSLLRMINMGYQVHSMHLHGVTFLVIAKDGHDVPQPYEADTLLIGPGERYDLLVKGRDGRFVFHDHTGPHATNDGVYPGGIHFMVKGGPPLDQHGRPDAQVTHTAHESPTASDVSALPLLSDADGPAIRAAGFAFGPSVIRVQLGTTVTWRNADFVPHGLILRAPDGTEVTRSLPRGGGARLTVDQKGTYTYRCLPHPFMTGSITVE